MKTIRILLQCFVLSFVMLSNASALSEGHDRDNGGFEYRQSYKLLKMAKETLLSFLSGHEWTYAYVPEGVILIEAIKNINLQEINRVPTRETDGRSLIFDYDVPSKRIYAMNAFFEMYKTTPDESLESLEPLVMKNILHEASHLIGLYEKDSIAFSEEVMNQYARYTRSTSTYFSDADSNGVYSQDKILSFKTAEGMTLYVTYQSVGMTGVGTTLDVVRAYPLKFSVCGPMVAKNMGSVKIPEDQVRILLNNYRNFSKGDKYDCAAHGANCFTYAMDLKRENDRCFSTSFLMDARALIYGKMEEGRVEPLMLYAGKGEEQYFFTQEVSIVVNKYWLKTAQGNNFTFSLYPESAPNPM